MLGKDVRQSKRLLDRIGTIGIDKQAVIANRLASRRHSMRIAQRVEADLHLDPSAAVLFHPDAELLAEFLVGVGGEPTAPVDRHDIPIVAKKHRQREL